MIGIVRYIVRALTRGPVLHDGCPPLNPGQLLERISSRWMLNSGKGVRKAYTNKKMNEYMDTMNSRYFRPRGLYAMVSTFITDPDQRDASCTNSDTADHDI